MYVQVQRTVNRLNRVWESRRLHLEKQLKPKDADSRCRQVGHTQLSRRKSTGLRRNRAAAAKISDRGRTNVVVGWKFERVGWS